MCIFCERVTKKTDQVWENEHWSAHFDSYPVTQYHVHIISKRHCVDYFELNREEQDSLPNLIHELKKLLCMTDPTIGGFNIGFNCGEVAGQTIDHTHCHLIPRRSGDMENPRGGVRGVIPEKQSY